MIRAMPTDKILLQIFALWCLLAAFDSYRPLSRPILDVSRHRILMSETVNTIGSTLSKDVTDTNKSMNSDESTQVALERLNVEREKKRIEFIAADLAVKKFTKEAAKSDKGLLKGTYDYGFTSKSSGPIVSTRTADGGTVPASAFILGAAVFRENLKDIINDTKSFFSRKAVEKDSLQAKLKLLKLSNEAIWKREASRTQVVAPWIIKLPYYVLCILLDTLFDGKPINRFYFLETVARMPYFSYITMLHAYETLGWWRRSTEAKRVHFAEEYNEYHHLLIMESLGGDQDWQVRFFAQHAAIVYYFVLIGLWLTSPTLAYNFSELIEAHAVDTYAEFAESNKELLMQMEAPVIAKEYYEAVDMYVFDEFQTNRAKGTRRPAISSLYDVFKNICEDEGAHVATMAACQDPDVLIRSPNTEAAIVASTLSIALVAALSSGIVLPNLSQEIDTVLRDFFHTGQSLSSTAVESAINTATTAMTDAAVGVGAAVTSQAFDEDSSKSIDAMMDAKTAISGGVKYDVKALLGALSDLISKIRL